MGGLQRKMGAKEYIVEKEKEYWELFVQNSNGRMKESDIERFLDLKAGLQRIQRNTGFERSKTK